MYESLKQGKNLFLTLYGDYEPAGDIHTIF